MHAGLLGGSLRCGCPPLDSRVARRLVFEIFGLQFGQGSTVPLVVRGPCLGLLLWPGAGRLVTVLLQQQYS